MVTGVGTRTTNGLLWLNDTRWRGWVPVDGHWVQYFNWTTTARGHVVMGLIAGPGALKPRRRTNDCCGSRARRERVASGERVPGPTARIDNCSLGAPSDWIERGSTNAKAWTMNAWLWLQGTSGQAQFGSTSPRAVLLA